jgi:hypothetical protein
MQQVLGKTWEGIFNAPGMIPVQVVWVGEQMF